MRAMIDVLPAEIPDLQRHRRVGYLRRERHGADLDAVGRWHRLIEALASQSPADLRLADPPVAQDHELDVADGDVVAGEIRKMRAQPGQAVVAVSSFDRISTGTPGRLAS